MMDGGVGMSSFAKLKYGIVKLEKLNECEVLRSEPKAKTINTS